MASLKMDGKMIFTIFVGAIIAIVLIQSIANQVVAETTDLTIANDTVTPSQTGNGTLELTGRSLIGSFLVTNATNGQILAGGDTGTNFTIEDRLGSDGLLSVTLITEDDAQLANNASGAVNVSYEAVADGAVTGASRNVTLLVTLFSAIAILIFVVVVLFANPSFRDMLFVGRRR